MARAVPIALQVMFVLAAVATTLPIMGGYVMGFSLLMWMTLSGSWRLGLPSAAAGGLLDAGAAQRLGGALRRIHFGVGGWVLAHLIAAIAGWLWSPFNPSLRESLSTWAHTATKLAALWFVLATAQGAALRLGYDCRRLGAPLAAWMAVLLAYVILQRQTGVDWTHGWDARLGPHRFAYGVYRVSGFMGHPLTFAYNLMIVMLASLAMGWRLLPPAATAARHLSWLTVAGLAALMLLLSGSRFVLPAAGATVLLFEARRIWRARLLLVALAFGAALLAALDPALMGRFAELFTSSESITSRVPRLLDWQIHSRAFLDHPWFGVTMAAEDRAMSAYYAAAGSHGTLFSAHNILLQTLSDTGLIGCIGLIGFFYSLISAARALGVGGYGIWYLALGTFISGLMQNNLRDSAYCDALWFFLSLAVSQGAFAGPHGSPTSAMVPDDREPGRKPHQDLGPPTGGADPSADLHGEPTGRHSFR